MKALTPILVSFIDRMRWTAVWVFRAHLPWDYICELDVEDWLQDNCTGKYSITKEKAFTDTYIIHIANKDDAIYFALRWINSEN